VGETPAAFSIAHQAVQSGRHVLIASPLVMPVDRLSLLYADRRPAQSLFVWSERRCHPAYRFVSNLIETDATWQPRYVRLQTLGQEMTTSQLMRWRTLEAIALMLSIASEAPNSVSAKSVNNPVRNAPDLINLSMSFPRLTGFLHVGLGEAVERRDTLLATASRKVYVDELNQSTPLRLVEDALKGRSDDRSIACPAPSETEMARQQCFAFLSATLDSDLAQAEARLWTRALATLTAADRSSENDGASVGVVLDESRPRFRLLPGRPPTPVSRTPGPPSVA
jgi:hypothetical protein